MSLKNLGLDRDLDLDMIQIQQQPWFGSGFKAYGFETLNFYIVSYYGQKLWILKLAYLGSQISSIYETPRVVSFHHSRDLVPSFHHYVREKISSCFQKSANLNTLYSLFSRVGYFQRSNKVWTNRQITCQNSIYSCSHSI